MEGIFVFVIYAVIFVAIPVVKRWRARPTGESLCLACVNALVTRGAYGKLMVACNVAGAVRPVKFTVYECTGFCVKAEPPRLVTIEGFVCNEREVYAEVAIR